MLGTSGSSGERSEPVTAKARVLPPFTSGIAGGPSEIVSRHCPPSTHRFDSLLPSNGIATAGLVLNSRRGAGEVRGLSHHRGREDVAAGAGSRGSCDFVAHQPADGY